MIALIALRQAIIESFELDLYLLWCIFSAWYGIKIVLNQKKELCDWINYSELMVNLEAWFSESVNLSFCEAIFLKKGNRRYVYVLNVAVFVFGLFCFELITPN